MEGLADRPMRLALARLQHRAAARLQQESAPSAYDTPPAALAARRALLSSLSPPSSSSSSSPGFDEACQEFIRVPGTLPPGGRPEGVARGVCRAYRHDELTMIGDATTTTTPLAAQLMGSDPALMRASARRLVLARGARHVSLNAGCPANQVTGNGAGSSLLRDPSGFARLVASMSEGMSEAASGKWDGGGRRRRRDAADPLVLAAAAKHRPPPLLSVKVRAGFEDASLFADNVLAARDGGAGAVVVHPRTKAQAYRGRADWALVDRARRLLEDANVPVVGNGDVVRASDALALALSTGCGGVMVGRGAVQDPLIFLRARAAFAALVHLCDDGEGGGGSVDDNDAALLAEGNGGDGDAVRAQSRLVRDACAAGEQALRFAGDGGEAALIESFLRDYVALADADTRARRGGGRGSAGRGCGGGGDGDGDGSEEGDAVGATTTTTPTGGDTSNERGRLGRLKGVLKYIFTGRPQLRAALEPLLRAPFSPGASERVLERACAAIREFWQDGGGDADTPLVNHMSAPPARAAVAAAALLR